MRDCKNEVVLRNAEYEYIVNGQGEGGGDVLKEAPWDVMDWGRGGWQGWQDQVVIGMTCSEYCKEYPHQ